MTFWALSALLTSGGERPLPNCCCGSISTMTWLDMLDVVHGRGHGALGNGDEALLHFLRRDARETPDHAHNRNVYLGKNVRSHTRDRDNAHEHDQNGHHREGVRPS